MIPATDISIDGDTAWLVVDHFDDLDRFVWEEENVRPCDTCGGSGYGEDSGGMGGRESCPDCIDGRHTFNIEVQGHSYEMRVSVVEVLPIVIVTTEPDGYPTHNAICRYEEDSGTVWPGEPWFLYTIEDDMTESITLPESAAPGKYAVQLEVAT
jgi:hypothetical protein